MPYLAQPVDFEIVQPVGFDVWDVGSPIRLSFTALDGTEHTMLVRIEVLSVLQYEENKPDGTPDVRVTTGVTLRTWPLGQEGDE